MGTRSLSGRSPVDYAYSLKREWKSPTGYLHIKHSSGGGGGGGGLKRKQGVSEIVSSEIFTAL